MCITVLLLLLQLQLVTAIISFVMSFSRIEKRSTATHWCKLKTVSITPDELSGVEILHPSVLSVNYCDGRCPSPCQYHHYIPHLLPYFYFLPDCLPYSLPSHFISRCLIKFGQQGIVSLASTLLSQEILPKLLEIHFVLQTMSIISWQKADGFFLPDNLASYFSLSVSLSSNAYRLSCASKCGRQ